MKSLNINIPTTIRFIRKIAKFWFFVALLLIGLLYTYFWLNSVDENMLSFDFETFYTDYDNVEIRITLNEKGQKQLHYQLPAGNTIAVRISGIIHDSTEIDSTVLQMVKAQWDEIKLTDSYKKLAGVRKKQIDYSINKASVRFDISTNKDIEYLFDDSKTYRGSSYVTVDSIKLRKGDKHLTYYDKGKNSYSYINEFFRKGGQCVSSEYIFNWKDSEGDKINKFEECQYFKSDFFESIRSKSLTRIHLSINNNASMQYRFKGLYKLVIDTYNNPLSLMSIYPQPDRLTSNFIIYNDPDKLETLSNQGILIYGESIRKKDLAEKMNFILASIIGVLFSVLAEIGVKHFENRKSGRKY